MRSLSLLRHTLPIAAALAPRTVERLTIRGFGTPRRTGRDVTSPSPHPWWVRSGDYDLAVYSAGAGPRVLLAHGWEGTAGDMVPLADELRARGYAIVTFDMPAHGKSSGRWTTLPAMARAIGDVARALGPLDAVVGHSLGATAALLALDAGMTASRAIAIAPPRDPLTYLQRFAAAIGLPERRFAGVVAALEARVGPLAHLEADRVVRSLRVAGLVLHDEADRQVPFSHGRAIAAAWPGASLVALDGVGHRRILSDPRTLRLVHEFVREPIVDTPASGPTGGRLTTSERRHPRGRRITHFSEDVGVGPA